MFYGLENTQPDVAQLLCDLAKRNALPSAMLFSGPLYSSRMYAASKIALLDDPSLSNTIVISDRNHSYRISAAIQMLKKAKNNAAKKFLIDTASVFLMQYHGSLFDSQSSTNRKKFSDAAECSDMLKTLVNLGENEIDGFIEKFKKAISPILDISKPMTVNQVRSIREWCNESSVDGQMKTVIIEGLENAGDSASNALLKTLEEPPESTRFILISSNIGRIPATILSRLRIFYFKEFSEDEKNYVLNSLFVNPMKYESIEHFILDYSGVDYSLIKKSAEALVSGHDFNLVEIVDALEKNQAWDYFFGAVIKSIRQSFAKGVISGAKADFLIKEIQNVVTKGKTYNQIKRLTFDFVVFRTMEVLA